MLLRSKNTFIFSSDFEALFTKHSSCEILRLNFEKKTVYLNYNFLSVMQNMPYGLFSMQHKSFELSDSQTRVLHNE